MKKVTAIIPTLNEEDNIEDAIASLHWADEIIVVDSFSSDNTVALAKKKGVTVLQNKFITYAKQKNWAIPQAKHEWVFLLDADERLTPELEKEVLNFKSGNEEAYQAFWIRRNNFFLGQRIRYSGWQGDKVIRLFKRDECRYNDKQVHEEITCNGKVGILKSPLDHYTFKDIYHYLKKWDRYSTLSAEDHIKKTPRPHIFHFLVKPWFRFFSHYILKLGFLDGLVGFILCSLESAGVFMRYVKIYQIRLNK